MKENMVKQLEMIQGIINRMGSNSFALKGWAVTLVAALFALASKNTNPMYFFIAYIPILVFWGLDSYYLQIERKYRNLYDYVRRQNEIEIDYNMSTKEDYCDNDKTEYINCLIAVTEMGFYIPLALISGVVTIMALL